MNQRNNSLTAGTVIRIFFIAVFITAVIVFLVKFKLENVTIYGGEHYSQEEIKELLFTEKTDEYAVLFYLRQKYLNKASIPFIEKTDIELTDRNSVVITVFDKALTGCIKHMGQYMFFDREGIIVGSDTERTPGIPEITGEALRFDSLTLNSRLDLGSETVFDTVQRITFLLDKNSINAERIDFGLMGDVSVYVDGNIFLLGRDENYDFKISNFSSVLDAIHGSGDVDENSKYSFDMRNYNENNMTVAASPVS